MAHRASSIRPCVLVVEDDPIIRMLAMDIVEDAGLFGIEAESAVDAITILETRDDIRVVFTDINMPGSWDGMRLANCIRDRWPPVEIILTSGKSRPLAHELPERAVFIPKPYQISKLTQMLNKFVL